MIQAHADLETFAVCDIKKCGGHRYSRDPLTEWLMLAVGINDEEPGLWVPERWRSIFDGSGIQMLTEADLAILSDPETVLYAHNATGFEVPQFDALFTRYTGLPAPAHHQWRCTAAMARRAALPASLAKCAEALKLPMQKSTEGMALIRKFSIPQKPVARSKKEFRERIFPHDDPEAFRRFGEYCLQDVRVERQIHKALKAFELKGFPLETFQLDLTINSRGLPVNLDGLRKAQALVEEVTEEVSIKFRALTGLEPTQGAAFLKWLKEHGYQGDDLKAETLEDQLEEMDFAEDNIVGQALKLRQQVSFAAVKKIPAMLACAGPDDNRVRGTLIYHGAGPGRWSGALVQPQNFKRPDPALVATMPWAASGFKSSDDALEWLTGAAYADICAGQSKDFLEVVYGQPLQLISSTIRHYIHDTENGPVLNADYSAIEACIMAWLAQEEWRLEVFRTHGKIYEASACRMFGLEMAQVTKPLRQKAKIAELALQYCGGVGALEKMGALKMGLTKEELPDIVSAWREANPMIVKFWKALDKAARAAIISPGSRHSVGPVTYFCQKTAGMNFLFAKLPSGRNIAYPEPMLEQQLRYEWEGQHVKVLNPTEANLDTARQRVGSKHYVSDAITIYGMIPMRQVMGRITIHAGPLGENLCQGIAADVMAQGAINLERGGYPVFSLIHDEALCRYNPEEHTSEEMIRLMTDMPVWADGLPLKAAGGLIPYYRK